MSVTVTSSGLRRVETKSWPLAGLRPQSMAYERRFIDLLGEQNLATFAQLYRSQPWVFAVVNKIMRQVGRFDLNVDKVTDPVQNKRDRVIDHPLAQLLRRPFPKGSPGFLKQAVIGSGLVYGRALVWKYRPGPGRPPTELWPIPWQNITVIDGSERPIDGYLYQGPLGRKIFLPEDVIDFAWWGPEGPVSPLTALARTLALEDAAQRYQLASFNNGNRPAGALVVPDGKKLQPAAKAALKAEIAATHEGPDNAFRMALLEGGLTWQAFSFSAADSEVVNQRKLSREEVCAAYDMSPVNLGILERATFSNVVDQRQSLYTDTCGPWFCFFEEACDEQLIREEPWDDADSLELRFDLSEILRADIEKRANAYAKAPHVWTSNDMRRQEGLPTVDDDPEANQLHYPVTTQTHEQAEARAAVAEQAGNPGNGAADPNADPTVGDPIAEIEAPAGKSIEDAAVILREHGIDLAALLDAA